MNLLDGSFRLFELSGITVRVHITLPIFLGFLLLDSGQAALPYLLMLFGTVLAHEFGHCYGSRAVGGDPREIVLWPLGGLAYTACPHDPFSRFVTVAAGPAVNVVFCLLAAGVLIVRTGDWGVCSLNPFSFPAVGPGFDFYLALFYRINLFLFYFNMLPIFPMDGGQLLQAGLWKALGYRTATIIAARIGVGGAIVFGVMGLMWGNFLLVGVAVMGAMACFSQLQSVNEYSAQEHFRYQPAGRRPGRGFWSRWFRREPRPSPNPNPNPNPGGWESKLAQERRREEEVDRILQKVHDQGLRSLSYIERQILERATRERQSRDFDPN